MAEINPYESHDPSASGMLPEKIPTGVMVICVLCLLAAIMGQCGVCMNVAGLFASEAFIDIMPEESREGMKATVALNMIPGIIQAIIGMFAAPLMVVGCIGCFTRKRWGRGAVVLALIGFIVWSLFALGVLVWLTLMHAETMAAPNMPAMGEESALQMFYFTQAFSIAISIGFLLFYVFALFYMNRSAIKEYFDRVSQPATEKQ